jgi:hypothetical protein
MPATFKDAKLERENLGSLYRELDRKYGERITIFYLDPRNIIIMFSYFLKNTVRKKISVSEAIKGLYNVKREAIFVDGKFVKNAKECNRLIEMRLKEIK